MPHDPRILAALARAEAALADLRRLAAEGEPDAEPDPVDELRSYALAEGFRILPGDLIEAEAAATLLGVSPRTLEGHRRRLTGPPFARSGGRVRYGLADIAEYMAANRELF